MRSRRIPGSAPVEIHPAFIGPSPPAAILLLESIKRRNRSAEFTKGEFMRSLPIVLACVCVAPIGVAAEKGGIQVDR
ncbi:MAG: hypothetical protein ACREN5_05890, partial [Gemmatimonadales bacterium]